MWNVNTALARVVPAGGGRTLELRVEAFNLLNHFNWGNPGDQSGRRHVWADHDPGGRSAHPAVRRQVRLLSSG